MNMPYPLVPVALIIFAAYFITWLFARWGIFSQQSHRRFWNVILLAVFLISGLIGIAAVIKINYKIEIPGYDALLRWHVAAGIGFVLVSFFHLSWHLKYYTGLFKKKNQEPLKHTGYEAKETEIPGYRILLFLLGWVTMSSQIVFFREFLNVTDGNELVLGIIMANWLLLTAWGAFSARKSDLRVFSLRKNILMITVLAVSPLAIIPLLYLLKFLLFPPGMLTGVWVSLIGSLLLLFPGCFLAGFLFTTFSFRLSEALKNNSIGKAYAFESIGSMAGGLAFSLIMGQFLDSFEVIATNTAIVLLSAIPILRNLKTKQKAELFSSAILLVAAVFIFNPGLHVKKLFFPNQEIVLNRDTPYGNFTVTRQAGQLNFYENNTLQFFTDNLMANEEPVHFAMAQHKNPKKILLVSGSVTGMVSEILKYNPEKITCLENNPAVIRFWKNLSGIPGFPPEVEVVKSDIRAFLRKGGNRYDVILLNLPAPSTLGSNRFYTAEFFNLAKQHCDGNSVVCTSLPSTANYAGENTLKANASLWATLGEEFNYRIIFQGEKNYFLASQKPLSPGITKLIGEKGIATCYVNSSYFNDSLLAQRSAALVSQFGDAGEINRDFSPKMFFRQTSHWLSYFGTSYMLLAAVPALLFLLFFPRMKPVTTGLYTAGFTAASLEVLLILAYQALFGSIYLATAFFFTVFMGGLALGSWLCPKTGSLKYYSLLQVSLAVFNLVLPLAIWGIGKIAGIVFFPQAFFYLLAFIPALIIGYEFSIASKLQPFTTGYTSGLNYSADLAGSAFGAFLAAIVLLPLLGLPFTCLLLAGLNLFSAARLFFTNLTAA